MADVYKALAHPVRREIIKLLRGRAMTAGELAEQFNLAKPTLSGHFAILREAGLVSVERSGTTLTYRLKVSVLENALTDFLGVLNIGTENKGEDK